MNYARPMSALSLIGLGPRSSQNTPYADILALGDTLGNAHSSAALDLRSVHTVYLHCPTLTNYKVLGPAGSRSIIARVAVDGLPGAILTHHHSGHVLDYIPCGGVTLQTLKFDVRNAQKRTNQHARWPHFLLHHVLCRAACLKHIFNRKWSP